MARGQQKELFDASGVIEAVARTGKAFKVGEDWYSVFEAGQMVGAQQGDEVEFSYSVASKGGKDFLNVDGDLTIVSEGSPQRSPARRAPARGGGSSRAPAPRREAPSRSGGGGGVAGDKRQKSIVRQNSLTQANDVFANLARAGLLGEPSPEELAEQTVELARIFEAYSLGED